MKKVLLSGLLIFVFVAYVIHSKNENEVSAPAVTPSSLVTNPSSNTQNTPTTSNQPTAGMYKNGTYAGAVADAVYGNIQVQVTVSGGKISDVQFLQYPNDRSQSISINSQAMPYLKQEAITAQNANVDIVGGATDSSLAFRQSLQSALSQAQ